MEFIQLFNADDDLRQYIFELELTNAGLDGRHLLTKRFPIANLIIVTTNIILTRKRNYFALSGRVPFETYKRICSDEWKSDIFPGGKGTTKNLLTSTIFYDYRGARIILQTDFDELLRIGSDKSLLNSLRPVSSITEFSKIGQGFIDYCEIYTHEALRHFFSIL